MGMNIGDVDVLAIFLGVIHWATQAAGILINLAESRNQLRFLAPGGGNEHQFAVTSAVSTMVRRRRSGFGRAIRPTDP